MKNTYTKYETKQINSEVLKKFRHGKFQVTVMKFNYVRVAPMNMRDYVPEMEHSRIKVCIQYSRLDKKNNLWNNQQIWINNINELEDLSELLSEVFEGGDKNE